jgi:hypothetical protein
MPRAENIKQQHFTLNALNAEGRQIAQDLVAFLASVGLDDVYRIAFYDVLTNSVPRVDLTVNGRLVADWLWTYSEGGTAGSGSSGPPPTLEIVTAEQE